MNPIMSAAFSTNQASPFSSVVTIPESLVKSVPRHRPPATKSQRWFKDHDWVQHRQTIAQLYITEDKSLKEVKAFMEQKYHLCATEKMFKVRFKSWKLHKNLRPDEALAMARVKAHRNATDTTCEFWRHGRLVNPGKLERFLRDHPHVAQRAQNETPHDDTMNGWIESILPPHIIVLSPTAALQAGNELHCTEHIIYAFQAFRDRDIEWARYGHDEQYVLEWLWYASERLASAVASKRRLGWQCLKTHFLLMKDQLRVEVIDLPFNLVDVFYNLIFNYHMPELARLWIDYFMQLCQHGFGINHPWYVFTQTLIAVQGDKSAYFEHQHIVLSAFTDIMIAKLNADDYIKMFKLVTLAEDFLSKLVGPGKQLKSMLEDEPIAGTPESAWKAVVHIQRGEYAKGLKIYQQALFEGFEFSLSSIFDLLRCYAGLGRRDDFDELFLSVTKQWRSFLKEYVASVSMKNAYDTLAAAERLVFTLKKAKLLPQRKELISFLSDAQDRALVQMLSRMELEDCNNVE